MMRFLSLLAVVALLIGSASDCHAKRKPKVKKAKPTKVLVAHNTDEFDEFDEETGEYLGTYYFYNVISVSSNALKRGHSNHDDFIEGETLPDGTVFDSSMYSKGDKIVLYVEPVEEEPVEEEPMM